LLRTLSQPFLVDDVLDALLDADLVDDCGGDILDCDVGLSTSHWEIPLQEQRMDS
jgi:hypothetical protein